MVNRRRMNISRRTIGLGYLLGATALRAYDAIEDLRRPGSRVVADPGRYGRARRAFALAGLGQSIAAMAAAETFAATLGSRVRTRSGLANAALLWTLLGIVSSVTELPGSYVEGFMTERSYGMSEQRGAAWLSEFVRGRAIEIPVGAALFMLAFALVRAVPKRWPLVAGAALAPVLVLANIAAPLWIAPLFNTFTPIEGPIAERLRELARRYGVGDARLLRVDMSRQTSKANAYVTGLFGTHRIVVSDTLLDGFADDEIEFVVAHELGHYLFHDTWRSVALMTLVGTATLLFAARGRVIDEPADLFPVLTRAFTAMLATGPLLTGYSRSVERRADGFAIGATDDPRAGVRAFTRLREKNLAEDEGPKWWEVLFASHPSLRSRIARLELAATPAAG